MSRTIVSGVLAAAVSLFLASGGPAPAASFNVTTFECDVTPPLGKPIYSSYEPLAVIEHPLMAKGVVLDDGRERYVLCAVDYCELRNEAHALFRREIAKAVGTDPNHVAVQSVHQHTAPMVDIDAVRILEEFDNPPPHPETRVFQGAAARLANAAKRSLERFQPCDSLGLGEARVERIAATRRVKGKDGKIIVRWSSCTDLKLRAMSEGRIDPIIKAVTFAKGKKPIVRLFYYATHPQSFYGDPRASYDVPGIARERLQHEEGVTEIYFTGCAGDVTMGKYNDRTKLARTQLANRLYAGMKAAVAATRYEPIGSITWRTYPLLLPRRTDPGYSAEDSRSRLVDLKQAPSVRFYRGAIPLAFAARIDQPIELCSLAIGKLHIVNLPGEPMIEFQLYAQSLLPNAFVAVAGYGDGCCGYLCTDAAYQEGGYEPTDALVAPGSEALLKKAIRSLLDITAEKPCALVCGIIVATSFASGAEPKLLFEAETEGIYTFDTGILRGRLRLDGTNQGINELVYVPSGQEVTYGGGRLALMSHYRLFTRGTRYGDAARDWPTVSKVLPDGAVEVIFQPAEEYPFTMKAIFRLGAADAIDVETIVIAKQDLPRFEVFLSNYFGKGYDASVHVVHSLRTPGKPYFLRADYNPLVAGNYLLFPRDRESVLTIFDGRWAKPPHPVEWCINRYLAAPVGVRRHKKTGLTAVLMAPPDDCFAVATPYNQDPPDGVANHRSLYLSLFGVDVAKGDTVRAQSRMQVLKSPSDVAVEQAYATYLADPPAPAEEKGR